MIAVLLSCSGIRLSPFSYPSDRDSADRLLTNFDPMEHVQKRVQIVGGEASPGEVRF